MGNSSNLDKVYFENFHLFIISLRMSIYISSKFLTLISSTNFKNETLIEFALCIYAFRDYNYKDLQDGKNPKGS